jgi:hypothetical protein
MMKDLLDDLPVFSFTALRDIDLANRQKLERCGMRDGIARQSFGPLLQCDAGERAAYAPRSEMQAIAWRMRGVTQKYPSRKNIRFV